MGQDQPAPKSHDPMTSMTQCLPPSNRTIGIRNNRVIASKDAAAKAGPKV